MRINWAETEALSDEELKNEMSVSVGTIGDTATRNQFILSVLERRENKRSERIMRRLVWTTVGLTAANVAFVALAAFDVI